MLGSSEPLELVYLPTEIIFCILALLGKKCRISATFVCKLFSTIILEHLGYLKVTVKSRENLLKLNGSPLLKNTKIVIRGNFTMSDDDFKTISGIRHLHIRDNISLTEAMLEHISGVHSLKLHTKESSCSFKSLHGIHTLRISSGYAEDEWLQQLGGIHTIDVMRTKITDKGLSALSGVHTIDVSSCARITDKGVIAISGSVHKIQLDRCNITDNSVKALTNASFISFSDCKNITDEGVKYLLTQNQTTTKIKKINLDGCTQISNDVLKLLAGIPRIELGGCTQLKDDTLSCLAGVHHIDLGVKVINISYLACVDDSTLKALAGVHTILLDNTSVTDKGLQYLVGVKFISLCECKLITDKGVNSLIGVKKLDLEGCSQITDDGIVNLTSLDQIAISDTQITKEMIDILGCQIPSFLYFWPDF